MFIFKYSRLIRFKMNKCFEEENSIIDYIKNNLSLKRYNHSLSVAITATNLATYHNENTYDAKIAGLLHDMAKEISIDEQISSIKKYGYQLNQYDIDTPAIIHGFLGAYMAKDLFDINNNVYNAIRTHSMGEANMTTLQKIIFISDYVEPFRDKIDNIDNLRKLAYINIDECVYQITNQTLFFLKSIKANIHKNAYDTLDYYKKNIKKRINNIEYNR